MLAIAVSVSKPFLKNDEGHRISKWVDKIVDTFAHSSPATAAEPAATEACTGYRAG